MRSVLIPLALVALIGHSWAEEQAAPTGGLLGGRLQGVIEPRLAANAIRIHDLEKHIEKLKTRIEEAKHVDPERFLHDLQARLDTIEGNHCEEHEFQCGGSGQECVSDLFVCDGHKDCHNGHDEDKDVCDASAIRAGKTFSGITHWKDCLQLNDHTSHLTILGTRKAHYFTSRIGVHAVVTSEYKQKNGEEKKRHFEFHGGYNFANRRLYLIPKYEYGQAHMALACIFDHGDFERLDCTIETEASQHVCAESHLTLQHHGYDNDDDDDHDHHDDDDHHGDDDHDKDAGHLHDDDHDDDDHKSHRGHRKSHGDH